MEKFFIYDCKGQLVGNAAGYRTYAAAQGQATKKRHALWATYDEALAKKEIKAGLVWKIKLEKA